MVFSFKFFFNLYRRHHYSHPIRDMGIQSVYETRILKYRDQVYDTKEYKPTWDEGYYICPFCKKNGLAFGPILRFFY